MANALIDDRQVSFLLNEVLDCKALCELPYFSEMDTDVFDLVLANTRRFARERVFPCYRDLDSVAPELREGRVKVHPKLKEIFPSLVELGLLNATRPESVGGMQLPMTVFSLATSYLMAANAGVYGYIGLASGAAHLVEHFANDSLKAIYLQPMYEGTCLGTMALTEPDAGSSLGDVQTSAVPTEQGHYSLSGNKIFISAGDHDLSENIVHMVLARIQGAPAGMKGVSLFLVPAKRKEDEALVDNDVVVSGLIHKIGWKALPSAILSFGDTQNCHGYLVGEANKGISYMFHMMNEARLMVGMHAMATASVAYHESLGYARDRKQGRVISERSPKTPQVAITEHADVRRMLLRQKTIVEGSMALLARVGWYTDLSNHAQDSEQRDRSQTLLNLLTPIAKSFPAEWGFSSNALALQIHGGYGYSSEFLPEAWLREQKLNSIHEGTTGIHSIDLLGRQVLAQGGRALQILGQEIQATAARAQKASCQAQWIEAVTATFQEIATLTAHLGKRAQEAGPDALLMHSADYLELVSIAVVAWQWLDMAAAAHEALARGAQSVDEGFYQAKLCAAQYWIRTELPRVAHLSTLCREGEDSYQRLNSDWL